MDMLKNSNYAIIPVSGTIKAHANEVSKSSNLYIAKNEGIDSGEEILDEVLNIFSKLFTQG